MVYPLCLRNMPSYYVTVPVNIRQDSGGGGSVTLIIRIIEFLKFVYCSKTNNFCAVHHRQKYLKLFKVWGGVRSCLSVK
jgi:hypothetical protein